MREKKTRGKENLCRASQKTHSKELLLCVDAHQTYFLQLHENYQTNLK
jgi:hypothetical protein